MANPPDLANPSTIRAVARRFGVQFQRRWGQNFFADRAHLERLVGALAVHPADHLVEVGPGLGVLTRELAQRAATVVGVEVDPACVRALALTLRGVANVTIVPGDILAQPVGRLGPTPYRVVGNIPYNLTGALFGHLLEQADPPRQIDLVVQKEVAERIASPGGDWSLATLSVRAFGRADLILTIPREAFFPVPKVASALLRILPEPTPMIPRDELPEFFQFVRPFFQARRKQLPYVLTKRLGLSNAAARAHLSELGIDPARRPETLSVEEWRRLFARRIVPA
jgi:16S rRNA (adenine1518-N6/adenine1519-N6)-dimethyltransferase